jgi:hypothetical protein
MVPAGHLLNFLSLAAAGKEKSRINGKNGASFNETPVRLCLIQPFDLRISAINN